MKKYKKHGYAQRLKYMRLLEKGYSISYIHNRYGIDSCLLSNLWSKYKSKGPSGLLKKEKIRPDYALKVKALRDIEENHLSLVEASVKYNVSGSLLYKWRKFAPPQGYEEPCVIKPPDIPLEKNDMGRPKKKKPEEMTELELLRYENACLKAENALLKKVKALVEEREARLKETGRKSSRN